MLINLDNHQNRLVLQEKDKQLPPSNMLPKLLLKRELHQKELHQKELPRK